MDVNLTALWEIMADRPTDWPTDRPVHREVSLPIMLIYLLFVMNDLKNKLFHINFPGTKSWSRWRPPTRRPSPSCCTSIFRRRWWWWRRVTDTRCRPTGLSFRRRCSTWPTSRRSRQPPRRREWRHGRDRRCQARPWKPSQHAQDEGDRDDENSPG